MNEKEKQRRFEEYIKKHENEYWDRFPSEISFDDWLHENFLEIAIIIIVLVVIFSL